MDVISAASSIIGVVELGLQLSTALGNFVLSVKGSAKHITFVADDIRCISTVLMQLRDITKIEIDTATGKTSILQPKLLRDIEAATENCSKTFLSVKEELGNASEHVKSHGFIMTDRIELTRWEKAKWPFFQTNLKELKADLAHSKLTLSLQLNVALLQVGIAQRVDDANRPTMTLQDPALIRVALKSILLELSDESNQRTEDNTIAEVLRTTLKPMGIDDREVPGRSSSFRDRGEGYSDIASRKHRANGANQSVTEVAAEHSLGGQSRPLNDNPAPNTSSRNIEKGQNLARAELINKSSFIPRPFRINFPKFGSGRQWDVEADQLHMWTISTIVPGGYSISFNKGVFNFHWELIRVPSSSEETLSILCQKTTRQASLSNDLGRLNEQEHHAIVSHTNAVGGQLLAVWMVGDHQPLWNGRQSHRRRPVWITQNVHPPGAQGLERPQIWYPGPPPQQGPPGLMMMPQPMGMPQPMAMPPMGMRHSRARSRSSSSHARHRRSHSTRHSRSRSSGADSRSSSDDLAGESSRGYHTAGREETSSKAIIWVNDALTMLLNEYLALDGGR